MNNNQNNNQFDGSLDFLDTMASPSPESVETHAGNLANFLQVANRYRNDEAFRNSLDGGKVADVFPAFGFDVPTLDDREVRVLANSDTLLHFVMPSDPNANLTDEDLSSITGAGGASSLSTVGTVSSIVSSTVPSSASTLGTAGTASP